VTINHTTIAIQLPIARNFNVWYFDFFLAMSTEAIMLPIKYVLTATNPTIMRKLSPMRNLLSKTPVLSILDLNYMNISYEALSNMWEHEVYKKFAPVQLIKDEGGKMLASWSHRG
jgi:hypothetical protein